MNALNKKSIIAAALLGSMVVASGAIAGIKDTPHNLSTSAAKGTNQINSTAVTQEICVFCHTPHSAAVSETTAPLWNKKIVSTGYTVYNTSTVDGQIELDGSVSLACLSCHDGTQAMDVMINTPGSGSLGTGTNDGAVAYGTAGQWAGGIVAGPATDGKLSSGVSNIFANLSKDISNDHPVGIQYGGGGILKTTSGTTIVGAVTDTDFFTPKTKIVNSEAVWWLDTDGDISADNGDGIRQKSDIQLYSRQASFSADLEPFVECASCHDPHSTNTTFLRVSNDGSKVCLACHNK